MLGYVSEREFKLQFEDSFKRFFKPLCFHAMSFVKDADIAKDIVHDVFLTTWAQREKNRFYSTDVALLFESYPQPFTELPGSFESKGPARRE